MDTDRQSIRRCYGCETPGKIEEHQIEYIINAIKHCRTLPRAQLEIHMKNADSNQVSLSEKQDAKQVSLQPLNTVNLPAKSQTWANVAA